MPPNNQRKYENETNLVLSLCFTCQVENISFIGYGLMAYNLIGKSSLNNIIIDLSVKNSNSYLRYQGLLLHYDSLPNSREDHYTTIINEVFFTCHYSKCHCLDYQVYDAGFEVVWEKANYTITILINNSYFYNIDQGVVFIKNKCSVTKNVVLFNNCTFESNTHERKGYLFSMITVESPPFNMNLSLTNCVFTNNDLWSYLIVIFRKSFDHDLCILPVDIGTVDPNTIHIKGCKFMKNKRPIMKVVNHDLSGNIPHIFLSGPIEFSQTHFGLRYSYVDENIAYMKNMIVHITGPVTISQNDVNYIFFFGYCDVTFSNKIIITSNLCVQIITIQSEPSTYIKIMEYGNIVFSNNALSNKLISIENISTNFPSPFYIFQYTTAANIKTAVSPDHYSIIIKDNFFYHNGVSKCNIPFYHYTSHCKWIPTSVFYGYNPGAINQQIIQLHDHKKNQHTTICLCPNNSNINCSSDLLGPVYPGQTLTANRSLCTM